MLKPLVDKTLLALRSPGFKVEVIDLWSIYDIFPTLKHGSTKSVLEEGHYPERVEPVDPNEPLYILHSSGSTGFPKPVYQTHKIVLQWASSSKFYDFM
jgi:acyl-coenzyme A synthetase/AMP-(fatty) acid ligase